MQRVAVPPARQALAAGLAGEFVADAAERDATCHELALAAGLVLQSMAHGILTGLEEPAEAVMQEPPPVPNPLYSRLTAAEELAASVGQDRSPEEALFLLSAAARSLAHRILVDWEIDPWTEGPERN
jgi:hypothetical protein